MAESIYSTGQSAKNRDERIPLLMLYLLYNLYITNKHSKYNTVQYGTAVSVLTCSDRQRQRHQVAGLLDWLVGWLVG